MSEMENIQKGTVWKKIFRRGNFRCKLSREMFRGATVSRKMPGGNVSCMMGISGIKVNTHTHAHTFLSYQKAVTSETVPIQVITVCNV